MRSWFSYATIPLRGSWKPVLSYCTSKYATRPSFESCDEPEASGLVMSETSLFFSSSERCEAVPAASIFVIAVLAAASSRCLPAGAATTTRSAAPFWAPNFAVIRSVAFWVSEPGILKSLISLPWKAAFSPISRTKMPSQVKITRLGWWAQWPAHRASAPEWATRRCPSTVPWASGCSPASLPSCMSQTPPLNSRFRRKSRRRGQRHGSRTRSARVAEQQLRGAR